MSDPSDEHDDGPEGPADGFGTAPVCGDAAAPAAAEEDGPSASRAAENVDPSPESTWVLSGIVIAGFLGVDFLTTFRWPQIENNEWLLATLCGACVGQVNLIATWAALAPGNIVVRIPWSLVLAMGMWYAFALGMRRDDTPPADDIALLGAILLAGVLIAQVPLWIAKLSFGWRMTRNQGDAAPTPHEDRQFHLSHLLLGTLLFAASLSLARLTIPPDEPFGGFRLGHELTALLVAIVVCNLVITVPCIWGALVSNARIILLTISWLVYCVLLTIFEFAALYAILGSPHNNRVPFVMFVLNAVQCMVVFGTLRIYRQLGYRLVRVAP